MMHYQGEEHEHWSFHDDLDPMSNAQSLLTDGEISGMEEGFIRGYMQAA